MAQINLNERGTLAVMQWIANNNTPSLSCDVFCHNGQPFLIVSDQNDVEVLLMVDPLETWHKVNGMQRLTIAREGLEPRWYFYINGKFYFATLY